MKETPWTWTDTIGFLAGAALELERRANFRGSAQVLSPDEMEGWLAAEEARRGELDQLVREWLSRRQPLAGLSGGDASFLHARILCAAQWARIAQSADFPPATIQSIASSVN